MIPGRLLHRVAARICSDITMQRVVEPAIADLQNEYVEAIRASRRWRSRWILGAGYVGVFKAVILCLCEALMKALVSMDERRVIVHSVGLLALTAFAATIALVAAVRFLPLHFDWGVYRSHSGYRFARAVPLAIAIAVPYVVAAACRRSEHSDRGIAWIIGVVASLSMVWLAISLWIVPKVTFTTDPDRAPTVIFGVFTGPGMERMLELSREERRRIALASPYPNHAVTWSSRFISYSSGSIALAPVALAVFVLAMSRHRRPTRLAAILVPTGAIAVYLLLMAFSDNTNLYPSSWWILDSRAFNPFPYLVWIPNAVLALLAIAAFTRGTRHRQAELKPCATDATAR